MGVGRGYGVQRSRGPHPRPAIERMWRFIEPEPMSGCWLWTGAQVKGYGRMQVTRRRKYLVHRVMWEGTYGPIPPDRDVLHRCDLPTCVNPGHLWLGTHSENMRDTMTKGRRMLRKDTRGQFAVMGR
jgi:HNH endonuclease